MVINNKLIDLYSKYFLDAVDSAQLKPIEVPMNVEWKNNIYHSEFHRWVHIEQYEDKILKVLHITAFPHYMYDVPIFGLDVIMLKRTNEIRALFFDMTPIINPNVSEKYTIHNSTQIDIPDWGVNIFSDNLIAIRPSSDEMVGVLYFALNKFKQIISSEYKPLGKKLESKNFNIQSNYCKNQRKNKHTLAALTKILGKDDAQRFMNDVLFPV